MKPISVVASRDHMPMPTMGISAADVLRPPRLALLIARLLSAIGRPLDRASAAIECWHLGRTLRNGEGHIELLEKSLERTKAEVDDLRIKLILAEKRRDS